VSRIDEALRRVQGGQTRDPAGLVPSQEHFASPWLDAPPKAASRPPTEAKPAPLVLEEVEAGPALPALNVAWGERLASSPACSPALIEQFRRLAATLHKAQAANGAKIVMVTSAAPSDGKTLTAINLALVLSGSYRRRVLLVDADLRRPSIGDMTRVNGSGGLSEALKARTEAKLALVPLSPMLSLLPSGRPDPDPIGGLTSPRMRQILDEAAASFDWVILDAPPLEPLADAGLLAEMVDGTVFVVRAGSTQFPLAQKAIEALGRDRVIGVVLNGVERRLADRDGQYYEYAASR
jgi:receptor protein-tyrosine kinase